MLKQPFNPPHEIPGLSKFRRVKKIHRRWRRDEAVRRMMYQLRTVAPHLDSPAFTPSLQAFARVSVLMADCYGWLQNQDDLTGKNGELRSSIELVRRLAHTQTLIAELSRSAAVMLWLVAAYVYSRTMATLGIGEVGLRFEIIGLSAAAVSSLGSMIYRARRWSWSASSRNYRLGQNSLTARYF